MLKRIDVILKILYEGFPYNFVLRNGYITYISKAVLLNPDNEIKLRKIWLL